MTLRRDFNKSLIIALLLLTIAVSIAGAAENTPTPIKAKPGDVIDLPVIIDKADNLAGVKLVINYDKELLIFKEGNTTKNTRSLMCVINDKNPGRLIVVMAGAKGVSGKDLPLIELTFEVRKDLTGGRTVRLDIAETQLMNDQLKEIKGHVSINPIDIK
jgi:hypothetical protein